MSDSLYMHTEECFEAVGGSARRSSQHRRSRLSRCPTSGYRRRWNRWSRRRSTRRSAGDDRRAARRGRPMGRHPPTSTPACCTGLKRRYGRPPRRGTRGPLQGAGRRRRGRDQLDLGVDVLRRRDRHVSGAARNRFDPNRLQPVVPGPTARRHRVRHCRQPTFHHEHGAALDHRSECSDRAGRGCPPRLAVQHRDRAADLHDHRDRPRARHRRVRRTLE
jgi:hypothetical protein